MNLFDASDARAAACPVTLDWFWIGASGSKRGYVQYDAQIRAAAVGRYTIRFSVVGSATNDAKHTIQAPGVDMAYVRTTLLAFSWPTATLGSLTIKDVTLDDGTQIQCADATAVAVLNSKKEVVTSFDDTNASWPTEVIAAAIPNATATDAKIVRNVAPDYPMLDRNARHEGTVTVEVTVGPDGHPLVVTIYKTSGYPGLDNAALQAARQDLYEPPRVNGIASVSTYIQQFVFQLR